METTRFGQCRCCLSKGHHEYISEDSNKAKHNYTNMIFECFNLSLSMNPKLTPLICSLCKSKIQEAMQFRTLVALSEQHLLANLENTDPLFINETESDLTDNIVIKEEFLKHEQLEDDLSADYQDEEVMEYEQNEETEIENQLSDLKTSRTVDFDTEDSHNVNEIKKEHSDDIQIEMDIGDLDNFLMSIDAGSSEDIQVKAKKPKKWCYKKKPIVLKPPCGDYCKFKCRDKISLSERQEILGKFIALPSREEQDIFVIENVEKSKPNYNFKVHKTKREWNNCVFYLTTSKKIRVCRLFFTATLSLSSYRLESILKMGRGIHNYKDYDSFTENSMTCKETVTLKIKGEENSEVGKNQGVENTKEPTKILRKYPSRKSKMSSINDTKLTADSKLETVITEHKIDDTNVGEEEFNVSITDLDNYVGNIDYNDQKKECNIDDKSKTLDDDSMNSNNHEEDDDDDVCEYQEARPIIQKKRPRNPENWRDNRLKYLRNTGQEYVSLKNKIVPARALKPGCDCRLKCTENFSEQERQEIFDNFWKMGDLIKQRQFIKDNSTEIIPKYQYKRGLARKSNYAYQLNKNGENIRVCKMFFLATLDVSQRTIRTALSQVKVQDNRGRNSFSVLNQFRPSLVESVRLHIESKRKKSFVDAPCCYSLYRDYKKVCERDGIEPASCYLYTSIFKRDFNLKFIEPMGVKCKKNKK